MSGSPKEAGLNSRQMKQLAQVTQETDGGEGSGVGLEEEREASVSSCATPFTSPSWLRKVCSTELCLFS